MMQLHRNPWTWAVLATLWLSAPGHAQELKSAGKSLTPRTELESALQDTAQPIEQRLTVRNDAGRYDVWLVSGLDFEKLSDLLRKAVGSRRDLGHGWRLEHWTYLESDRSYVGDLTGQGEWRLRLTRHLNASLIEVENLGDQGDAPPWAPPYRPRPVLMPHGSVR